MVQQLRPKLLMLAAALALVAGTATSYLALVSGVAAATTANSVTVNPSSQSDPTGTTENESITATDMNGSSSLVVYQYINGKDVQQQSWDGSTAAGGNLSETFSRTYDTAQNNVYTAEIISADGTEIGNSAGFTMAWTSSGSNGCPESPPGTVATPTTSPSSPDLGEQITLQTSYDGCVPSDAALDIYETPGDYTGGGTIGMANQVVSCPLTATSNAYNDSCTGYFTAQASAGYTTYTFEAYLVQYGTTEEACSGETVVNFGTAPAISLTASNSSVPVGDSVSLTATVTQDASSDWNTYICETTSPAAQVAAQDGNATSLSGTYSESSAVTDTFIAYMTSNLYNCADPSQTPNPGILATSGSVQVTWSSSGSGSGSGSGGGGSGSGSMGVTLSASPLSPTTGSATTLTATVTGDNSNGSQAWITQTSEDGATTGWTSCPSDSGVSDEACPSGEEPSDTSTSVTASSSTAGSATFEAYLISPEGSVAAQSPTVTVNWSSSGSGGGSGGGGSGGGGATDPTLTANPTSLSTGQDTTLTASDSSLPSGDYLEIEMSGTSESGGPIDITSCESDTCSTTYNGEYYDSSSGQVVEDGTEPFVALVQEDTSLQSPTVDVTWSSSGTSTSTSSAPTLTANPTSLPAGQATTLTATDDNLPSGDYITIALTANGGPGTSGVENLTSCDQATCTATFDGTYTNSSGQQVTTGTEPFVAYILEDTSSQSPTVDVTWTAPPANGTCSVPANEGPTVQTDSTACTLYTYYAPTVNLTYTGTVPSNEELTVLYGGASTGVSCSPGEDSCQIVNPRALSAGSPTGPLTFQAGLVLASDTSTVESEGSEFTVTWVQSTTCPPGGVYSSGTCSVPIL